MVEVIVIIIAFAGLFFNLYLILMHDEKESFQARSDIEKRQEELQRLYRSTKELEKRYSK